tara:strand:+ start:25 stop:912 length:888 start_codon:yes stop_codon:yes gene_type:complete
MAHNKNTGTTILFGGISSIDGDHTQFSDTWAYDGTVWDIINPFSLVNSNVPTARMGHSLVFDEKRNLITLMGGNAQGTFLDDTWVLNNNETGVSFEFERSSIPKKTIIELAAIAVVQKSGGQTGALKWDLKTGIAKSPITVRPFTDPNFEIRTQQIKQSSQIAILGRGHHTLLSARFADEIIKPNTVKEGLVIDYIELRFLYDLDHDNTQIEPACGDGVIQPWLGEACDDLNTEDGDYCSADCTQELAWCGDGDTQENAGEVCDGDTDTYWCSSDCWFKLDKDWDEEGLDGGVSP